MYGTPCTSCCIAHGTSPLAFLLYFNTVEPRLTDMSPSIMATCDKTDSSESLESIFIEWLLFFSLLLLEICTNNLRVVTNQPSVVYLIEQIQYMCILLCACMCLIYAQRHNWLSLKILSYKTSAHQYNVIDIMVSIIIPSMVSRSVKVYTPWSRGGDNMYKSQTWILNGYSLLFMHLI